MPAFVVIPVLSGTRRSGRNTERVRIICKTIEVQHEQLEGASAALLSALVGNNNNFTIAIETFLATNKRGKLMLPSDPRMVGITQGKRTDD